MTKIQKASQRITPFAGISFINSEFNRCGLSQLIDKELGLRTLTGYRYSDIFRSWFDIFFCGGDVAEDTEQHLRPTLESIPDNKIPSPDTILRGIKELAVENTRVVSSSGKPYQFNINRKLNDLNIKSLLYSRRSLWLHDGTNPSNQGMAAGYNQFQRVRSGLCPVQTVFGRPSLPLSCHA
jgi:hypothetical protein